MARNSATMAAGKLRTRLDIERHNGATTTRGQKDEADANWIRRGQVWGGLETLSGEEVEHAHKQLAGATHRLTLRHHPGLEITAHDRLRETGTTRVLNLGPVLNQHDRDRKLTAVASEAVAQWTPSVLQPDLWLDAKALNLDDAAAVASWPDRSGNGNDFTQATGGKQPTFDVDGITANRPAVSFDGGNTLAAAGVVLSGAAGYVAAVIRPDAAAQAAILSTANAAAADAFLAVGLQDVAGENRIQTEQQDGDTADNLTGDDDAGSAAAVLLVATSDGSTTVLRVNGVAQTITANTGANNGDWFDAITGATNTVLGGLITSGGELRLLAGRVAELVAADGSTELADIEKLETYLLGRWAIS